VGIFSEWAVESGLREFVAACDSVSFAIGVGFSTINIYICSRCCDKLMLILDQNRE